MHDNWIEIQFQTTGEVLGKSKFVTNLRQANKRIYYVTASMSYV